MVSKLKEREEALILRRQGLSYSEILKKISVAKSTLSLWLRSVGLARPQIQRLTEKRRQAALRGAQQKRAKRLRVTEEIKVAARKEIGRISERELWLMGIMLYWAEGTKEKDGRPGSGVKLINSDPYMVKLFLTWLKRSADIGIERVKFEIYIHESAKERLGAIKNYWTRALDVPLTLLGTVYYKKNKLKTNRKNTGENYFGLVNIRVRGSSTLNRKIAGWIEGVCKGSKIV